MEANSDKPKKIQALEDILQITLYPLDKSIVPECPNSYAISENNNVTHLNLSDNELKDIKCLNEFTDLEGLYLYNNNLTNVEELKFLVVS